MSCLELCMVCEARQREEQTQFTVVIFRGTELLQGVETLDCFLHGQLQLKKHEAHFRVSASFSQNSGRQKNMGLYLQQDDPDTADFQMSGNQINTS